MTTKSSQDIFLTGANGNDGDDKIIGNRKNNILNGGLGNDTIAAHDGDDTISPGKGNDKVQGGEGIDTVIYPNKRYKNTNIRTLNNNHIIDIDDKDILLDIEFIQFADIKIEIEVETLDHH